MKQLINKFLKEQEYSKGQIYKVCPDVLLKDFINFVDEDKKVEYSKILTRNPIRQPGAYEDLIELQKNINYKKKISGPIIDRIDLHVEVPRVKFEKLSTSAGEKSSASIKERVESARRIQADRLAGSAFMTNGEMSSEAVKKFCPLDNESLSMIRQAGLPTTRAAST